MKSINAPRSAGARPALAIFPGSLGDLICASPALAELRKRHRRLEIAVKSSLAWLAAELTGATVAAALEDRRWAGLFSPSAQPVAMEWLGQRAGIYSWLGAGDPHFRRAIVALSGDRSHFYRVIRESGEGHVTRQYLEQVTRISQQLPATQPGEKTGLSYEDSCAPRTGPGRPLGISPAAAAKAAVSWPVGAKPRLLIHPGSGSTAKRWARSGFLAAIGWWRGQIGGAAVVLLGPAEQDELAAWAAEGISAVYGLSVEEAAAQISSADLYLGNDSGISHLAGTVGARGVVIFGPTDPIRWAPIGGRLVPLAGGVTAGSEGISIAELGVELVIGALEAAHVEGTSVGNQRSLSRPPT